MFILAISCSVCYGPHICDNVYIPATRCNNPEQQFCINDVENNGDGSRIVTKRWVLCLLAKFRINNAE